MFYIFSLSISGPYSMLGSQEKKRHQKIVYTFKSLGRYVNILMNGIFLCDAVILVSSNKKKELLPIFRNR